MKFGQLIEYNMRNILLDNHTQNVVEKLFPGIFLKGRNWAYLCNNILKFFIFCFNCSPNWGLSKMIGRRESIFKMLQVAPMQSTETSSFGIYGWSLKACQKN